MVNLYIELYGSTNLTEKRRGTYDVFAGSIFIRTEFGVKEVLKYPFDQDRWVLEKLVNVDNNDELVTKTSYEPLFIFKDKDGKFLPLERRAVEYYMHVITNGTKTNATKLQEKAAKKEEAELEYCRQEIGSVMSDPNQMDLVL